MIALGQCLHVVRLANFFADLQGRSVMPAWAFKQPATVMIWAVVLPIFRGLPIMRLNATAHFLACGVNIFRVFTAVTQVEMNRTMPSNDNPCVVPAFPRCGLEFVPATKLSHLSLSIQRIAPKDRCFRFIGNTVVEDRLKERHSVVP